MRVKTIWPYLIVVKGRKTLKGDKGYDRNKKNTASM